MCCVEYSIFGVSLFVFKLQSRRPAMAVSFGMEDVDTSAQTPTIHRMSAAVPLDTVWVLITAAVFPKVSLWVGESH